MARTATRKPINWQGLISDIISNHNTYHEHYYNVIGFSGPSLHFHHRALNSTNPEKIELVYAVLTAWGMHRMGKGGAKMNDFHTFKSSILDCEEYFQKFANIHLAECGEFEFESLKNIFAGVSFT